MNYIHLIALLMTIMFLVTYAIMKYSYRFNKKVSSKVTAEEIFILCATASIALLIRFACAAKYDVHSDLSCFQFWADRMFQVGPGKFYSKEVFADYPPGYMYVLWAVGALKDVLHAASGTTLGTILVKSPAMICDMLTGVLVFKFAKRYLNSAASIACFILYVFNPIVILNSSVWGQVDSVFTLGLLLMCYFIFTKNTKFAYFAFGLSALIKPQTFMFTPVLFFAFLEDSFIVCDNGRSEEGSVYVRLTPAQLIEQLKYMGMAILTTVLLAYPFGLMKVVTQIQSTMKSYPYASVNAYNMWAMFGLDWADQNSKMLGIKYAQWGTIFIICICFCALLIWITNMGDRSRYLMMAIFISTAMFTVSVRMHERYIYPGVILMLMLFIINRNRSIILYYAAFSVVHFYNAAHVLFFYNPSKGFDSRDTVIITVSLVHCIVFGIFMTYCVRNYMMDRKKNQTPERLIDGTYESQETTVGTKKQETKKEEKFKYFEIKEIEKTKVFAKMLKIDFILMLAITLIYSAVALKDLGDRIAPTSFWETQNYFTTFDLELPEGAQVSKISYYLGNYEDRDFTVSTGDDLNKLTQMKINTSDATKSGTQMNAVFCWASWNVNISTKYIRFVSNSNCCVIGELVLLDAKGNKITPVNVDDPSLKGLFDEQKLYPKRISFRNGTYFDEIYHARTAYEYIHDLYCYENTHPPLGKGFIALGILIFGMNPFGWRIAGTVFGIFMVPLMYVFGKKMFGKTNLAAMTCILFTFDFMHFAQTRIATIDVYVTFFVIAMYFFMYRYYTMSFYDTKLYKTFIPLLLCGISMGLGCASKWTGCYAGAGLGVLFFITLIKRYREYLFAKRNKNVPDLQEQCKYIIDVFWKKTAKTFGFCLVAFLALPATIYTLAYIPFNGVTECPKDLIGKAIFNAKQMYDYHTNIKFEHPYASKWYEWPIMIRPIWYYSGELDGRMREGISAMGNPLVWWVGIPAFVYLVYLIFKKKDQIALFLSIGFLAQLLPWILVVRLTFIYHYFPSVPFIVLMIGYCMYRIFEKYPKATKFAYIYVGAAVCLFVLFYPVLAGQPVDGEFVKNWLRWFGTWVFISY